MSGIPKDIKATLYIDGKPAEASIKNVQQVTRTLERELNQLTIGTDAWNQKMKEVAANKKYLKEVKDEINGVGGALGQLRQELGKVGTLAAGYLGFEFITTQFQGIISGNAKLSDSLSDIRRVTGLTEAGVLDLDRSLGKLDTRTSKSDLRGLAVIAGRLGIARNEILGFVEAADKLTVSLGSELGNADEITDQLGKILNVFEGNINADNITRLGNAMVGLANDGAASGGFIAKYTQLVSGIAEVAGLSLPATMALGAGLEELGGRAESSATATQKLLIGITQNKQAYRTAGISLEEFNKLLAESPDKALLLYAKGLAANKTAFAEFTAGLEASGEEGARTVELIAKLGQKSDFFNAKIEKTGKLYQETGAINDAYTLKNQNLAAVLEKVGKEFNSVSSNTTLINFLTKAAFATSDLIGWIKRNSEALASLIKILIIGGVAWGTYRTYLLLANSSLGLLIGTLIKGESVMALSRTSTIALAGAKALLSGNLVKARQAWALLNLTMAANPIGAVLAGIVAVIVAISLFSSKVTNAAKIQQNFNDIQADASKSAAEEKNRIETLVKIINSETESRQAKLNAVNALRQIMPDYLSQYTKEEILAGKATTAIRSYIAAIEQKAKAEATGRKLADIDGSINDIDTKLKNGYSASTSPWERLKAGFNQKKGETTEQGWRREMADQKAALVAQQRELRDSLTIETAKMLANTAANTDNIKSLDSLKLKLEEATKARAAAAIGSKEFNDATKLMVSLQKEIDKYDLNGNKATEKKAESAAETARKKAISEFEKLGDDYKKLNLQRLNDQLSANEKELKQEADKYDSLIEKEREFLSLKGATPEQKKATKSNIAQLELDKQKAVNDLAVRQESEMVKEISDLRTRLTNLHATELEKQKAQINQFYDDLEAKSKGNETALAKLRIERAKEIKGAELRETERLAQEKADIESRLDPLVNDNTLKGRKAALDKKYDDEIAALKLKFSKELQLTKEFQDAVAAIEKNRKAETDNLTGKSTKWTKEHTIQAVQEVSDATFNIMQNNRNSQTEKNLNKIEKERKVELEAKNLTEAKKTEINAKYDAIVRKEKLRAWKADQQAALGQAVINGALAVVKALPNIPLSIISGIAAAAQIATIVARKPPEFAGGGMSDEEPSGYVSKTTLFNRSASGRPFIAGEKGREWIAPNWMLANPAFADIIGTLEIARREKRMFANGGFNTSSNSGQPSIDAGFDFAAFQEMFIQFMQMQTAINNKKVYLVNKDLEDFQTKVNIENSLQGM